MKYSYFSSLLFSLIIVLFFFPSPTYAHVTAGHGLVDGATHPLFGIDHLLAMIAVGILGSQLGGKAKVMLPGIFLLCMILGGFSSWVGITVPRVETGIALSLLVFGGAIAITKKLPLQMASIFVAVFALFHGQAHAAEMPTLAAPTLYAIGFLASTAGLHMLGIILADQIRTTESNVSIFRSLGLATFLMGLVVSIS